SVHRLVRTAYSLLCDNPEFVKLSGRDGFSILANTCRYSAKRPSCGTGAQTFLLDADGTIYPCLNTNLREFRVANIRDSGFDFASVWRDSPLLQQFRRVTSVCEQENHCSPCPVKHWCLGGCRGETHATRGSLSEKAYNCTDLRKAVVEVMWCLAERPELVRQANHIC
ncbi:MAG: SPASM domain-containing protein, partial [Planctomycetota bacterium]